MKKIAYIGAAFVALLTTHTFAADSVAPAAPAMSAPAASAPSADASSRAEVSTDAATPTGGRHPQTLEEARKRAHERAEKLDKMTPEEYAAKQQKSHEWREKWKAMTPDEKAAYKKQRHDERAAKKAQANTTTATPATPATNLGVDPIR